MQLKQSNDVSQQYKGTIAGLRKIINDEGLNGLYKGTIFRDMQSDERNRPQVDSIGS
jgi:hypothetical protein